MNTQLKRRLAFLFLALVLAAPILACGGTASTTAPGPVGDSNEVVEPTQIPESQPVEQPAQAVAPAPPVQTSYGSGVVGLTALGLVADIPATAGGGWFFLNSTGVSVPGVTILEAIGPSAAVWPQVAFATYFGLWASYFQGVQTAVEGPPTLVIDGVQYRLHPGTQQVEVLVLDWDLASQNGLRMALEMDADVPSIEGSHSPEITEQQAKQNPDPRGGVTVVVADDDPKDLAEMAVAAQTIMRVLGFNPVNVVQCLNDFECIKNAALFGGPDGGQAKVCFLDGGFVGMRLPEGAPYPSVPAKSNNGYVFTSGPWIASFLKQLGYGGVIIYVSTEGYEVIREFKGEGAELGPAFKKDNFFPWAENFAHEIGWRIDSLP